MREPIFVVCTVCGARFVATTRPSKSRPAQRHCSLRCFGITRRLGP